MSALHQGSAGSHHQLSDDQNQENVKKKTHKYCKMFYSTNTDFKSTSTRNDRTDLQSWKLSDTLCLLMPGTFEGPFAQISCYITFFNVFLDNNKINKFLTSLAMAL